MMENTPIPGGLTGSIAAALAVVTWAGFKLRSLLSKDKVSRQGDDAIFDVVKMQREQLDRSQEYINQLMITVHESSKRIADMANEIAEANVQADKMRKEISRMTDRIEALEAMVRSLGGTP